MKHYQYIYFPDIGKGIPEDIISNVLNILSYADMESGELESLQTKVENTQLFLANLIGMLEDKNIINKNDWKKLIGYNEDK